MSVSPFIKPLRVAGSFYTFPSASEDLSYTIANSDSRKVVISYFALLNLPDLVRPSGDENTIQLDAIPGAYMTVEGTDWNKMFTESFQNYCLNREKMITSTTEYDADVLQTVSERNFYDWLKSLGAIRFREATPAEVSNLSTGKRYVEEDSKTNGYKRVIQYVGEVDMFNNLRHYGNSYSEVYIHIPTKDGHTPLVMFKSTRDVNFEPNMFFQNDPVDGTDREYLLGRHSDDTHPAGLNFEAAFDSDVSTYDDDNLYLLEKKDSEGDYQTGWWFPNPMQDTYFTEPHTFDNPGNDFLRITGQGGDKTVPVELTRSKLSGITIDFNLDSYNPVMLNSTINSWSDFNSSTESSSFEFNTVLLYYDVYDQSTPENRTTNLYGVLYADTVNTISTGGGQIPRFQKFKPNRVTGDNGTAYAYKVNLKFDISTDDAKIETSINEYSPYSLHLFLDALNELRRSTDILTDNSTEIDRITSKVNELESLILTTENFQILEEQINTVTESLASSKALVGSTADIIRMIENIHQEVLDIYNNRTSVQVAWSTDVLRQGDGIQVDRTIPNQVTIRNTRQTYSFPAKAIISVADDWEQDQTSWYYNVQLSGGTNYLRIEETSEFVADRNMVLFIDDSISTWKKGQAFRISFGTEYLITEHTDNFSLYIYTDAKDTLDSGKTFQKLVIQVTHATFLECLGKPIVDVICVDPSLMIFAIDITGNKF